jgi:hypothetical protein
LDLSKDLTAFPACSLPVSNSIILNASIIGL